jgi:hypothetical protein
MGARWRVSRPRSADGTREALIRAVAPTQSSFGASARRHFTGPYAAGLDAALSCQQKSHLRFDPYARSCEGFDQSKRTVPSTQIHTAATPFALPRSHAEARTSAGHAEPRRERPRGRACGRYRAQGPGSFTPRFRTCADRTADMGRHRTPPHSTRGTRAQVVALLASCRSSSRRASHQHRAHGRRPGG